MNFIVDFEKCVNMLVQLLWFSLLRTKLSDPDVDVLFYGDDQQFEYNVDHAVHCVHHEVCQRLMFNLLSSRNGSR